jgi:flagellar export protein FliJ
VIAKLQGQLEAAHQALLQAEYRLAGFKQLLKARRAELQVVQHRRDQRVTDEFAAMSHFRARTAQTTEEPL